MRGVTVLMLSMLMLMQLHRCTAYVAIGPHKSVWPMGSAAGPARTRQVCVPRVPLAYRARRESLVVRPAVVALSGVGETISTPGSIADMMKDAGDGVLAACSSGVKMMAVEVPLPITGGTELDDWPGGIGQKYETLRPMLAETLRSLGFSAEQIASREFMSLEDDAIGIWQRTEEDGSQLSVVVFATPEVLGGLQELAAKGTLILVNHQFFLDQFSRKETKDFIAGCEIIYLLQSLNMKGPGLLPVKGVLRRSYPGEFVVARRVDAGVFEVCCARPFTGDERLQPAATC